MDLYRSRKFELVDKRIFLEDTFNTERTNLIVIQLNARAGGSEVFGFQPDLVIDEKSGTGAAILVSAIFVDGLGYKHLVMQMLGNLFHRLDKVVNVDQLGSGLCYKVCRQRFRWFEAEARILTRISQEKRGKSSGRGSVIS